MITLDQAKALSIGQTLWEVGAVNADNTPRRWRVSGKPKVWKRSPSRVQVPIKHGMYTYGYVYDYSLHLFELPTECIGCGRESRPTVCPACLKVKAAS